MILQPPPTSPKRSWWNPLPLPSPHTPRSMPDPTPTTTMGTGQSSHSAAQGLSALTPGQGFSPHILSPHELSLLQELGPNEWNYLTQTPILTPIHPLPSNFWSLPWDERRHLEKRRNHELKTVRTLEKGIREGERLRVEEERWRMDQETKRVKVLEK